MTTPSCEHAIIGAGIVGLSTAMELVSRGVEPSSIAVLDPQPISGATCAAGGMLAPVAEVQYQQEALYPLMQDSAQLWVEVAQRLAALTAMDTGYRTESTFVVGADHADGVHLKELTDHQHLHGMNVTRIPLRQARRSEPGLYPNLVGVVEIPNDHQVNPVDYSRALIDVLTRAGVRFLPTRVEALSPEGDMLYTRDGEWTATTTYLCAGLGASAITGWYAGENSPLKLRPVRGDMLHLQVPEARPMPVGRVTRAFVEDRPVYIIPRSQRRIVLGATSREDARRLPAVDGVYTVLQDAIRIVPGLEDCEFVQAITGDRPGTPDDLPYLGKVGEHLVVSTGYFRHGILLSALGARVAVDLAVEGHTTFDVSACAPLRHATYPPQ